MLSSPTHNFFSFKQSIFENTLKKEGLTKHDLGREKFIERLWEWKEKYGKEILTQFEALGASVDWDRFRFTLDDSMNKACNEAFIRLFEKGIIYRSDRLVNWSCQLQSALSNEEIEKKDINEPTAI